MADEAKDAPKADVLQPKSLSVPVFVIPAILGIVLGGIGVVWRQFGGANTWLGELSNYLLVLVSFVAGTVISLSIRVIELGNLIKSYTGELNSKLLTPMRAEFDALSARLSDALRANERMGKLEGLLRNNEQFEKIHAVTSAWCKAYESEERFKRLSSVIQWKRERVENSLITTAQNLDRIGSGQIEIDDPVKELALNSELIKLIAENEIRAVSFEDADFWSSSVGRNTLAINKEFIERKSGRRVRRLFIEKAENEYGSLLKEQAEAGILVRTIRAADVPGIGRQYEWDFVVYDNTAVRIGFLQDSATAKRSEKKAVILMDVEDIQERLNQFEALWEIADDFKSDAARPS